MANEVVYKIRPGEPFAKTIVATLPTGRDWWLELANFEVLSQIREKKDRASGLILDLADFMTTTMPDEDTINIELDMKGEDTRLLTKSGFHDLFISDTGTADGRGYYLINGPVKRFPSVTKETKDLA